jgi:hypothetical protein
MPEKAIRAIAIVMACAAGALAQNQTPPTYVREYCIKVTPGNGAAYAEFAHEISTKLNQARADAGEIRAWLLARAIAPAGASAKCDYLSVWFYSGFPHEPLTSDQMTAALERAHLNLNAREFAAKRDSLSTLVSVQYWRGVDSVGQTPQKGNYLRLNHYKVKSGQTGKWVTLETTMWKPVVAAHLDGGGTGGWAADTLIMPLGDSMPYNAITVDIFADWASYGRGIRVQQLWSKVHPNLSLNEYNDQLDSVREVNSRDVVQVVEHVGPKAGATTGSN